MNTCGRWLTATSTLTAGLALLTAAQADPPGVRCTVELDREVLPAEQSLKAVIKVTLEAPLAPERSERPPVNLAVVLDRSGSMSGDKIEKAKQAAIEAVRRLNERDMFSLIIYDHEVDTLVPAQSAGRLEWIEARIRGIQARGNTALFGGVSQGAAEVRKHLDGPYIHRVILLSDGLANVGPNSPADLGRLGTALLKEGISVTTVGAGMDFNEDLMTRLSQTSDGNHYFVETSGDLPRIFALELGDVLSVVARKVVVEIECPNGVRPIRIIGRDGTIQGRQARLHMNQLYGGQAKHALIEIEVPSTPADQQLQLAVARCTYEDPIQRITQQTTAEATAQFSLNLDAVRQSADPTVNRVLLENEMAVARDQALDLYNTGKSEEAGVLLRSTARELSDVNVSRGLDELAKEAAGLEAEANAYEDDILSSPDKKRIRAESYRTRTQQKSY